MTVLMPFLQGFMKMNNLTLPVCCKCFIGAGGEPVHQEGGFQVRTERMAAVKSLAGADGGGGTATLGEGSRENAPGGGGI